MRLGLGSRRTGRVKTKSGIDKIGGKELVVLDLDTGSVLEERVGMLWGGKDLLTTGSEPLLSDEYFSGDEDEANYLIVVVRCDSAIDLDD